MNFFYTKNLSVSPFLDCSSGFLNSEDSTIFGSDWWWSKKEKIISACLNATEESYCNIFAATVRLENKLVILQLIKSEFPDNKTQRKGLFLVYGAVIDQSVFHQCKDVCKKVFIKLNQFLKQQTHEENVSEANSKMILLFQNQNPPKDLIKLNALELLVRDCESTFYIDKKPRNLHLPKFISNKKLKFVRKKTFKDFEDLEEFWEEIDALMHK